MGSSSFTHFLSCDLVVNSVLWHVCTAEEDSPNASSPATYEQGVFID